METKPGPKGAVYTEASVAEIQEALLAESKRRLELSQQQLALLKSLPVLK